MKKTFSLAALCCLAFIGFEFCSCNTHTDNTPADATMPKISRNFDDLTIWFEEAVKRTHPFISSAWNSDADVADFNLLLVNQEKNRICKITPEGKKELPESEWSENLKNEVSLINSFGYTTLNGLNHTLILCDFAFFDEKAEMTKHTYGHVFSDEEIVYGWLALFYHESFHQFVQRGEKGWMPSETPSDRSQTYPIDYQPRIYRKLALIALKNAWLNEAVKSEQYARAKYWMNKYEKNYAQEAELIKSYDVDESSAEYFSRFILHSAFPSYDAMYDIDGDNITSGVDAESYMQCAALQLLHRDGRLNEAIEACKSCTLTPINCLPKNTKLPDNYDEHQDAADIKRITEAMDKAFGNNPMLQSIGEIIKRHKAGQQHYLAVRTKSGAYVDLSGEYNLTELPGLRCIITLSTSLDEYEIEGLTVLGRGFYYLIPLAGENALSISDVAPSDELSPIEGVIIEQNAQLTALQEKGLNVKMLPTKTLIGKDSFGNKYYICRFN